MKANALALSLILLLVPLAGCSGTDTEVTVDMDSEDLQAIIDDNRDDFLNNTTVVIFQEYHNNTTVVNQYSNNTTNNMDQSGTSTSTTTYNYNGSSVENGMQVFRTEWGVGDMFPEITPKRENQFTINYSYFDYATNDDRTDEFTMNCSNYYDAVSPQSNTSSNQLPPFWDGDGDEEDDYRDWWGAIYNNTIRDLLDNSAWENIVTEACKESDSGIIDSEDYRIQPTGDWRDEYMDYSQAPVFLQMTVENGTALDVIEARLAHRYTDEDGRSREVTASWTVNGYWDDAWDSDERASDYCPIVQWWDDSERCGDWYGGWDDLSLTFQLISSVYYDSEFSFTMYYEIQPISS